MNSFAKFSLRKDLDKDNKKQHKKYFSCHDGCELINEVNQNLNKNSFSSNVKFETNKEFIENYTNYVN